MEPAPFSYFAGTRYQGSLLKYYLFMTTSTQELPPNPAAQPRKKERLRVGIVISAFESVPNLLVKCFFSSEPQFLLLQLCLRLCSPKSACALRVQAFSTAFASDCCLGQSEGKLLQYRVSVPERHGSQPRARLA